MLHSTVWLCFAFPILLFLGWTGLNKFLSILSVKISMSSLCFSWKEMWLQDYWQSLDQGEALTAMLHNNESHQGRFWDYMHKIFMKRTRQNWLSVQAFFVSITYVLSRVRIAVPTLLFYNNMEIGLCLWYLDFGDHFFKKRRVRTDFDIASFTVATSEGRLLILRTNRSICRLIPESIGSQNYLEQAPWVYLTGFEWWKLLENYFC